jgi:hypothetical protein
MNATARAAALAAALSAQPAAGGQDDGQPPMEEILRELRRLRDRVDGLEGMHRADLERIRQLEERLLEQEPPPPGRGAAPDGRLPSVVDTTLPPPDLTWALPAGTAGGQGNLLNPAITVFLDFGFSLSTDDDDPALNRFNLRETEIDLRAAVTPWADGALVLAFPEETETDSGGDTDVTIEFEIEEAFLNAHTLPFGFALKGGKFRNAFGRNNLLHTHDLPQVDRPLAAQAFLGPEGLSTVGGSASWLVPNPWDAYIEIVGELVNADGGEESPILGGPDADNPAALAHVRWFGDLGDWTSLELGGSYLYGHTSSDGDFDANVFGADATIKWLDPSAPDLRSLLLQAEFFWAQADVESAPFGPSRNDTFGFYAFGQYQFARNWYTGVRFDYTEFPDLDERPPGDEDWAVSPYVSWYPTEFLRLRLEYQHLESLESGDWNDQDNLFFAVTVTFGAHPPHPYWVNR